MYMQDLPDREQFSVNYPRDDLDDLYDDELGLSIRWPFGLRRYLPTWMGGRRPIGPIKVTATRRRTDARGRPLPIKVTARRRPTSTPVPRRRAPIPKPKPWAHVTPAQRANRARNRAARAAAAAAAALKIRQRRAAIRAKRRPPTPVAKPQRYVPPAQMVATSAPRPVPAAGGFFDQIPPLVWVGGGVAALGLVAVVAMSGKKK